MATKTPGAAPTCGAGETSAGGDGKCTALLRRDRGRREAQGGGRGPSVPLAAIDWGQHSLQAGVPGWEGGPGAPSPVLSWAALIGSIHPLMRWK